MLKIFEQKNDTLAFILIAIATIFWGGFGLVSAHAQITNTPPLLFVTLGTLFSLLTAILAGLFSKNNNLSILKLVFNTNKNNNYSDIEKSNINEFRKTTLLRALAGFGPVLTMAGFYLLDNKVIGVLISETSPIFSILISYFVFKKDFFKNNLIYDWLLIGLSFLGILILSLKEVYLSGNNSAQLWGVVLSLGGALLVSYGAVLSPRMTTQLSKIQKNSILRSSLSGVFITNLLIFCIFLIPSIAFYSSADFINLLDSRVLLTGLIFGVFVSFSVNFLSRVGGAIATTHNIFLVWFLTPIIGTLLLWLFDYGEITPTIVLAFILILVPNILLNLNLEWSLPLKTTFIWILLSTAILFYTQGKPIASASYFNSVIALLMFFALAAAYLIKTPSSPSDKNTLAPSQNPKKTNGLLPFSLLQTRLPRNFGKFLVLLLISIPLIIFTTLYRTDTFLYDIYALITSTTVVLTLALAIQKIFYTNVNPEFNKPPPTNVNHTTTVIVLTLLIIAIIALFFAKHNFTL